MMSALPRVPGPLGILHSDNLSIDSVRGLASLLLVGWHVFGDGAHDGLHRRFPRSIGVYSYSVYLLNVFFTAPARTLTEKAGVS